jgi:DNA-directed RNA polymerase subunit K/omega
LPRSWAERVSSTSLVSFDRNRYSVACKATGRTAELRSYADKIVVLHDGELVAQHSRRFQRDQMIFDPWHYLPVLKKKPGALRNGAPFKEPPVADCARYDRFRKEVTHVA